MYNQNFTITRFLGAIFVSLLILNQQVWAQEDEPLTPSEELEKAFDSIATDFTKDISAIARDQEIDGRNKISILIENVVINQGSLEITADRVEADASNGKGNEVIRAVGAPATYQQRLEDGSKVTAQANTITYNVAERIIALEGNAQISQNQSMVTADSISYNMLEEKIIANSDEDGQQQVNTIISFGEENNEKESDQQ